MKKLEMPAAAVLTLLLFFCVGAGRSAGAAAPLVATMRLPGGGIQPQISIDGRGRAHMVYYVGEPMAGDLYYVSWLPGRDKMFSKPVRVNSQPGAACAMGTIRGAQIAIGKADCIHVVWNSSAKYAKTANGHIPLFYSRLHGGRFEPERDLIEGVEMLDGGSSVAADREGHVYVVWHGAARGEEEARGRLFMSLSDDEGAKFSRGRTVGPAHGACACCSLKASVDRSAALYILYRTAVKNTERDVELLSSTDHGKSFRVRTLQRWQGTTCPMSAFAFSEAGGEVLATWENDGQVSFQSIESKAGKSAFQKEPVSSAGKARKKYPCLAASKNGRTILTWVEDAGWQKGGSLSWQVNDDRGKAAIPSLAEQRAKLAVPAWSFPGAVGNVDGGFTIIF